MTEEDKVTAAGLGTALPAEEKPEAAPKTVTPEPPAASRPQPQEQTEAMSADEAAEPEPGIGYIEVADEVMERLGWVWNLRQPQDLAERAGLRWVAGQVADAPRYRTV